MFNSRWNTNNYSGRSCVGDAPVIGILCSTYVCVYRGVVVVVVVV